MVIITSSCFSNTIQAVDEKVDFLDATVSGIGVVRQCTTELLLGFLKIQSMIFDRCWMLCQNYLFL
jgi:hypothetical protein